MDKVMKVCFSCKKLLPLILYKKNPRIYQNLNNMGRNYVCKICTYKDWVKYMSAWLWNEKSQKFEKIKFNNKKEIIKTLLFSKTPWLD